MSQMWPENKTPLWQWAVVVLSIVVIVGAIAFYVSSLSSTESQNPYVPPQTPAPPPPPVSTKLKITCINLASVDIHVWVYVNGVEVVNGILGHGFSSPSRSVELSSGGKVTTVSSLTYEKWTIPGVWSPGDVLKLSYNWDGKVTYTG